MAGKQQILWRNPISHILNSWYRMEIDDTVTYSTPWEQDYTTRGKLWGGSVNPLLSIPPDSQVLELGCGNGKTLAHLVSRGFMVTAVDFSPRATTLSREVVRRAGTGDVAVADARLLPFTSGSFHDCLAFHVIGHGTEQDRAKIAREASRVLTDRGVLWFSEFSTEDMRAGTGTCVEPQTYRRGTGICTHYFTEPEVRMLFCDLTCEQIGTRRWTMRVRGKDHIRAEIVAVFRKESRDNG